MMRHKTTLSYAAVAVAAFLGHGLGAASGTLPRDERAGPRRPDEVAAAIVLGGFRAVVIDYLWVALFESWERGDYFEVPPQALEGDPGGHPR